MKAIKPGRVTLHATGESFALIGTGNTKTGAAFSLSNIDTCPGATALCKSLCYVGYGNMAYPKNRQIRDNRTLWVMRNMPQFAALMVQEISRLGLKTLRIHDSGDFFSPTYVRTWIDIASQCPDVKFWFYTRSYTVAPIATELRRLASLPNVAGWLSVDHENIALANMEVLNTAWRGMAIMQLPEDNAMITDVRARLPKSRIIIFPTHVPGGNIKKGLVIESKSRVCPAITKSLHGYTAENPACIKCKMCLPA